MMSESNFFVGDIGVELRANLYYPLNDAECLFFLVKGPKNNAPKQVEADIVDIEEGIIKYITKDGDFSVAGEYTIQANIIFNDGSQISGDVHTFRVHNLFE